MADLTTDSLPGTKRKADETPNAIPEPGPGAPPEASPIETPAPKTRRIAEPDPATATAAVAQGGSGGENVSASPPSHQQSATGNNTNPSQAKDTSDGSAGPVAAAPASGEIKRSHPGVSKAIEDFDVYLFDIEGTVCPISFVKEVLFPYALQALPSVLSDQWDANNFAPYRDAFPEEYRNDPVAMETHIRDLVARDVKASYLKSLQGYLWTHGYETGELKAPLFSDVAPFLEAIQSAGKKTMIYSSGSVPAQKLLFGHTNNDTSDLSPLISDWFDTVNAGMKTDAASYRKILAAHPEEKKWLFFSDMIGEVEAAREAGMTSLPLKRGGNGELPNDNPLSNCAISSFTAEEVERGMSALAAMEKTLELDGTIAKAA